MKIRPLQILIVHDSRVISDILREYILTDHPDAHIEREAGFEEAVRRMEAESFDVVFSGLEMKTVSGFDIHDHLQAAPRNIRTPLVLLSPSPSTEQKRELSRRGLEYVLPVPCTSIEFRELLYRIFNPESNRVLKLYTIPHSKTYIRFGDRNIRADIFNISTDSIICGINLDEAEGDPPLSRAEEAVIQFPADYGKASTICIYGDLTGAKEIAPLKDGSFPRFKVHWRIAWRKFELQAATKRTVRLGLGETDFLPPASEQNQAPSDETAAIVLENETLGNRLDAAAAENEILSQRVSRLQHRIAELEAALAAAPVSVSAPGVLLNEAANPTQDEARRSIFKKIIEDNMRIREGAEA